MTFVAIGALRVNMSTVLQKTYFHVSVNGNGSILGKYMCFLVGLFTPGRQQLKTPILSRNVDQKSIEIVFATNDNRKQRFY